MRRNWRTSRSAGNAPQSLPTNEETSKDVPGLPDVNGPINGERRSVVHPLECVWRDTVIVRPKYKVTMRAHYRKFTGRAVLHCQILAHEDEGMMQVIDIGP